MNIRTISQLPPISEAEAQAPAMTNSLMEVSYYNRKAGTVNSYISKSITYDVLSTQLIEKDADKFLAERYNLINGDSVPYNIGYLSSQVDTLSTGNNCIITGTKRFDDKITLNYDVEEGDDQCAVSKGYVDNNLKTVYPGLDSIIYSKSEQATPFNHQSNITQLTSEYLTATIENIGGYGVTTDGESKEVELKVDNGNGQLVVFGWVTDNGAVLPAQAWIALEYKINNGNWQIVQLQPWILGTHHSRNMQYFSFSFPYQSQTPFRIITGFQVSLAHSGFQSQEHSLTFTDTHGRANGLIAYVIS